MEIDEEEEKTQSPQFWDDPKAAEQHLKKIKGKKPLGRFIQQCSGII